MARNYKTGAYRPRRRLDPSELPGVDRFVMSNLIADASDGGDAIAELTLVRFGADQLLTSLDWQLTGRQSRAVLVAVGEDSPLEFVAEVAQSGPNKVTFTFSGIPGSASYNLQIPYGDPSIRGRNGERITGGMIAVTIP